MTVLADLIAALTSGSVQVVDLTAPLSSSTPLLELPLELVFAQSAAGVNHDCIGHCSDPFHRYYTKGTGSSPDRCLSVF